MEIVQSWRIVWQKGTRYVYKRVGSIMHAASFSYLGLYLCEFFFFFFSPLSWCLSNYFCAIVMRWLYNEFFFYVEIVILFNDFVKVDTSKKVYCVMNWSLKKYLKSFLCDFFKIIITFSYLLLTKNFNLSSAGIMDRWVSGDIFIIKMFKHLKYHFV